MRRTATLVIAGLALGAAGLWGAERIAAGPAMAGATTETAAVTTFTESPMLTLAVPSMTCGSCEGRITRALEMQAGVRAVAVDLRAKIVRVSYDAQLADPRALADVVTAAGYPARYLPPDAPLPVPAKSAGGCGGGCCDNRG